MVGDIGTGLGTICSVLANGQVMSEDRSMEGNSPLWRVKTYNVDCCVFWDSQGNE